MSHRHLGRRVRPPRRSDALTARRLLSKWPIVNSTHHLLPSPHGELAPAIYATLDVLGHYIDVIVAHSPSSRTHDRADRPQTAKRKTRSTANCSRARSPK